MYNKKSIKDIEINEKRIFLRVDFNVPLKNRSVECDHKIKATLPTIKYILERNPSKLIIASHLGRPKQVDEEYSVKPIVKLINEILKIDFTLCDLKEDISEHKFVFLENLRFFKEEKNGYKDYFTKNADIAVIDSFGCAHRDDKSLTGTNLPTVMGLLMEKELSLVHNLLNGVDLSIFGGAKISDKLKLISEINSKKVWLVGAIANTVLKDGFNKKVGISKVEEGINLERILKLNLSLPNDFVVKNKNEFRNAVNLENEDCAFDIGKESQCRVTNDILKSKSVFWNGPSGVFEMAEAEEGTKAIAKALTELKKRGGTCYVGGGETAMAALKYGGMDDYTHVSTGGGALMTLLGGGEMPGIDAIENK